MSRDGKPDELLLLAEAAPVLGLGKSTLRDWVRRRLIRSVRIGNRYRVPMSAVIEALKETAACR